MVRGRTPNDLALSLVAAMGYARPEDDKETNMTDHTKVPELPDGWVLVPKEPTPEMIAAGFRACRWNLTDEAYGALYAAMLQAAPAPSVYQAAGVDGWEVESMLALAKQLRDRGDDLSTDAASWLEKFTAAPAPAEAKPAEGGGVTEAIREMRETIGNEYMDERARRRLTAATDALEAALRGKGAGP